MQPAQPPLMPDPVMAEAAEATKRKLFRAAMQGQWHTVIAIYTDSSYVQAEKITPSEDTVLHVAVSAGMRDVVKRLVDAVAPHDPHRILEQQNEKGNTPLHLAAALGMVEVCAAMAKKCPLLAVEARNNKGETPLFLAAKYGKKDAFFALHDAIESTQDEIIESTQEACSQDAIIESTPGIYNPKDISYCRRYDGDTILHVAISAEHFELALEIIYLYEPLVNFNNERGETALHCLANKPDVFKSGSRFDQLGNLIYSFSSFKHRSAKKSYIADEEDPDEHVEQSGLRSQGLRETLELHKKKKIKHVYACQIMDELVTRSLIWEYTADGKRPGLEWYMASAVSLPRDTPTDTPPDDELGNSPEFNHINSSMRRAQHSTMSRDPNPNVYAGTPILMAAKQGVTEMVEKILVNFPIAVEDMDSNDKIIILLAAEHQQLNVYQFMLKQHVMRESVFGRVDKDGNSALHLAATLGQTRPWIPGSILHMQSEIRWFQFVLRSMVPGFFQQYNNTGQTAREIFTENHEQIAKDGGSWLKTTSESCSVVASLIATVVFASATTVPGGVNDQSGIPTLEAKLAFQIFALSALIALCFSVTSLIMFLSFLTSQYREWDFEKDLPVKLIIGQTSMFMSIWMMLASFCAGHVFVVEKKLKYVTLPIYTVMCLAMSFFAVAQFPLYVDLVKATFERLPDRTVRRRPSDGGDF